MSKKNSLIAAVTVIILIAAAFGAYLVYDAYFNAEKTLKITLRGNPDYFNVKEDEIVCNVSDKVNGEYVLSCKGGLPDKVTSERVEIILKGDSFVKEIDTDGIDKKSSHEWKIEDCANLEKLTLSPGSLVYIKGCPMLSEIILPSQEESSDKIDTTLWGPVGDNLITEFEFPGYLCILNDSFSNSNHITSVKICEGVEYIDYSFNNCPNLECVNIPESVLQIYNSFEKCPKLTLTVVPGSIGEEYAKNNDIPYQYKED